MSFEIFLVMVLYTMRFWKQLIFELASWVWIRYWAVCDSLPFWPASDHSTCLWWLAEPKDCVRVLLRLNWGKLSVMLSLFLFKLANMGMCACMPNALMPFLVSNFVQATVSEICWNMLCSIWRSGEALGDFQWDSYVFHQVEEHWLWWHFWLRWRGQQNLGIHNCPSHAPLACCGGW